jgi:glycosyltransferase involved in cell wall biosynthesis
LGLCQKCEVGQILLPTVSIILPTFNGARYLRQSIDSCLGQFGGQNRDRTLELIVVDDCSTDETPQILCEYGKKDARIKILRNESNRKLPASLNRGFQAARGEFLTWTSDDNRYRPHALEEMLTALSKNSDVDLVYADMTLIDENGLKIGVQKVKPPETLVEGCPVGACFLYRKKVFQEIGDYSEDLFLAEDYDYWLRVSCRFKLLALSKDLYEYRHHARSLTWTQTLKVTKSADEALRRSLGQMDFLTPEFKVKGFLRLAKAALLEKNIAEFYSYLKRSLGTDLLWTLGVGTRKLGRLLFPRPKLQMPK